jgi:oligosaccharyltransferase complex subunit beta
LQTFSIEISEYVYDKWQPYVPPAEDQVQLEFRMLSPFHRLTLSPTSKTADSTVFSTHFILPDQHGIFTFRVNYKRPFLTYLDEKVLVTVRHFAHNEWPRSWTISAGWVWIAGIWTTIAGFMAFSALWLYSAPVERKTVKKVQ